MAWFTDQSRIDRGEFLPWSLLPEGSYSRNWLKFFSEGANMKSQLFTDNTGGWHGDPNDLLGGFYAQAFSFMSEFSSKYLGKDIESYKFGECRDDIGLAPCGRPIPIVNLNGILSYSGICR